MIIFALSRNIDPQRVLILAGPVTSTAGMSSLEPVAAIVVAVLVGVHSREGGFDLEKKYSSAEHLYKMVHIDRY